MMDTVLNLGLNDWSVVGLARQTGDERFAYDSYRRFVAMYGRIVLDVPGEEFDALLEAAKELAGTTSDAGVPVQLLQYLVDAYQQIVERHTGRPFPQDPDDQLRGARSGSPTTWARPSTSRPWCSATGTTIRARAWASPATRPPGRRVPTATSW
jgi:pyruvate,orthophosphate dikinase